MDQKVYLAGFDVFYPNAKELGDEMKKICRANGFIGMFPMDNSISINRKLPKSEIAKQIFQKNIELINEADIVVANLNVFRGAEPDSGTSFEIGYAYALKKKIYGYMDDSSSLPVKVSNYYSEVKELEDGIFIDKDGIKIENLDNPVNLMLSVPTTIIFGSFEDCIKKLADSRGRFL
ncbi:nucleoside 2-deoxyribosyltransferase [Evansella sp. AB-P1]|uniref:nucleoside 2-deoxyribosyltransferase n=1 Tax=Evansella sp. AB-P1 TaxID=3037653 RepID=UPI00241C90F8|nr:nucleoside 2-deoxyribosyltransferase [Evansella sp. AB-P1]MDG5789285.1 nucleoside 2-deoxyribosyltransferase [Evansella sp. AB-P1]